MSPLANAEEDKTRVLLLPYEAVFRSAPQATLNRATQLLKTELEAPQTFEVLRGAVSAEATTEASKGTAATLAAEAEEAEEERFITQAVAKRRAIVDLYAKSAATAKGGATAYIDALHRYALTQMVAGDDKGARTTIDEVARMSPTKTLDPAVYSRLYQRWYQEAVEAARKDKPGQLLVTSSLPGASINLDGRTMGVAPVRINNLMPGTHMITARIEGAEAFSGTVEIKAGNEATLEVVFRNTIGGQWVGKALAPLAENQLTAEAIASAKRAGEDAEAAWTVFGAMSRDVDRYRVHTFLMDVRSGQLAALEVINLDLELLTAQTDVLKIVRHISSRMEKFGDPAGPTKRLDQRVRSQPVYATVDGSVKPARRSEALRRRSATKRSRRPVIRPLKGGTIVIKDEAGIEE